MNCAVQARRDQVRRAGPEARARGASRHTHAPEVVRGKPHGQAGENTAFSHRVA